MNKFGIFWRIRLKPNTPEEVLAMLIHLAKENNVGMSKRYYKANEDKFDSNLFKLPNWETILVNPDSDLPYWKGEVCRQYPESSEYIIMAASAFEGDYEAHVLNMLDWLKPWVVFDGMPTFVGMSVTDPHKLLRYAYVADGTNVGKLAASFVEFKDYDLTQIGPYQNLEHFGLEPYAVKRT